MFLSFLILKKHNRCKKNAYSSAFSHKNTTQTNMRGVTSSVIFHLVYMNSLKGYVSKLTVYWCGLTLVQVVK
jgi:hypothetical protein